ncbi:penicillin-binding protein 1A [Enterovirga rhinocerotis]|uniref:Membrane carboxypeptidase/penicillin-binding protein n=1 Tax=Enterovirga rhinocerotis TaxID=1339210 RepID=A0A4R7BJB2_9HYPH|nr:transglycosylase domain-containing protein [Enterovirga rhinocerotis]TDR85460.1 membrane carboxypeptidase/penicillin-binding protein [Enterovirga rhinocerotis]
MSTLLIKLFATALTFSQVTTRPDSIRTSFDPVRDQAAVSQSLTDGCTHLRKAFDVEDINVDELIATAMEDPKAVAGDTTMLKGLDFKDLELSYRQFCKGSPVERQVVDLGEVIRAYNEAMADLPDVAKLKGFRMPGASTVLDGQGERYTEIFPPDGRRAWVPLRDIPEIVRKAFVAAEDKRFFQHGGIDERGVIRAFMTNLASSGRPQGGSTITQQVVKNILVGDDITYQRKMREMVLAARLERILGKDEILEIYLNAIYLGRSSWGVEMAARSFFGKSVGALDLREAALLATLPKGPNYYDPERHPERSRQRLAYVLTRLLDDGVIDDAKRAAVLAEKPTLIAASRSRRDSGFYVLDHLTREARTFAGVESLTASSYTVRSTIDPALQRATEAALQDGLARYELGTGRFRFEEPEGNLGAAIERLKANPPAAAATVAPAPAIAPAPESETRITSIDPPANPPARRGRRKAAAVPPKATSVAPGPKPDWLRALEAWRAPLYDVHWPSAVVLDARPGSLKVGLADGRILPLQAWREGRKLKLHDVVLVRVSGGKGGGRAELRVRPSVQGAAIVLENRTGRILAMTGGFSYPLSQLNRATQAVRQPGSTLKPLAYLAALAHGVQPNTLLWDRAVTLPPIGGVGDSWTPRNADRSESGLTTLRRALESSKNQVTAGLLDGVIEQRPEDSLQRVCNLALEAELYAECERYYPFVLGAQPVRPIDLAVLYAAIANEGIRPSPHVLESVAEGDRVLYRREARAPVAIRSADNVAFYQLKTMLQGVVSRGTARSMRGLAPYVGGKTGTSENENDAWFAGFSNDVSIVVWVGNDNADGKRRTLGRGQTGGKVAVPIFEAIMKASWASRPRTPLAPPSPEARQLLADVRIDLRSGERSAGGGFVEHLRRSASGAIVDTQHRFVGRGEVYAQRDGPSEDGDDNPYGYGYGQPDPLDTEAPSFAPRRGTPLEADSDWYRQDPSRYAWPGDAQPRRRPRRVDPEYLWAPRDIY